MGAAAGEGRGALLGHPAPPAALPVTQDPPGGPKCPGQRGLEGRLPPRGAGEGPPAATPTLGLCLSGVAFPRWPEPGVQTQKETDEFLFSITGVRWALGHPSGL